MTIQEQGQWTDGLHALPPARENSSIRVVFVEFSDEGSPLVLCAPYRTASGRKLSSIGFVEGFQHAREAHPRFSALRIVQEQVQGPLNDIMLRVDLATRRLPAVHTSSDTNHFIYAVPVSKSEAHSLQLTSIRAAGREFAAESSVWSIKYYKEFSGSLLLQ